jgi:hypothetical protein
MGIKLEQLKEIQTGVRKVNLMGSLRELKMEHLKEHSMEALKELTMGNQKDSQLAQT